MTKAAMVVLYSLIVMLLGVLVSWEYRRLKRLRRTKPRPGDFMHWM